MKIINKLERKFGRFGIPHLTNYILVCYVIGYLLSMTKTSLISYLYLEPGLILQGQIWRLITWVLVPPGMSNILFVLIMLMFYYSLGTTLERTWGTFRYTLYIFSGLLFTVIGAFLLYFIEGGYVLFAGMFSTYYISMSILLAFAVSYPDMRVLLYFVIPIKMKWMAFVYVAMIGYRYLQLCEDGCLADGSSDCGFSAKLYHLLFIYTGYTALSSQRSQAQAGV